MRVGETGRKIKVRCITSVSSTDAPLGNPPFQLGTDLAGPNETDPFRDGQKRIDRNGNRPIPNSMKVNQARNTSLEVDKRDPQLQCTSSRSLASLLVHRLIESSEETERERFSSFFSLFFLLFFYSVRPWRSLSSSCSRRSDAYFQSAFVWLYFLDFFFVSFLFPIFFRRSGRPLRVQSRGNCHCLASPFLRPNWLGFAGEQKWLRFFKIERRDVQWNQLVRSRA